MRSDGEKIHSNPHTDKKVNIGLQQCELAKSVSTFQKVER